jgi:cytochrome c oxidase cbb3-type subunit III
MTHRDLSDRKVKMKTRNGFLVAALFGAAIIPGTAFASADNLDGKLLFTKNCAACHGETGSPTSVGQALKPFPARNLRAITAYVGRDELRRIITNGVDGTSMNPKKYSLNAHQIEAVIDYIDTLQYPPDLSNGKKRFEAVCSGCHGMDGRAKGSVGAANLVNSKLDLKGIVHTIRYGRPGTMMTSKRHQLDNTDIADVANYVYSLRYKASPENGKKLYASYCISCHATPSAIKFIGNAAEKLTLDSLDDNQLNLRIRHGRHVERAGNKVAGLSDDQVQDIVSYLRKAER